MRTLIFYFPEIYMIVFLLVFFVTLLILSEFTRILYGTRPYYLSLWFFFLFFPCFVSFLFFFFHYFLLDNFNLIAFQDIIFCSDSSIFYLSLISILIRFFLLIIFIPMLYISLLLREYIYIEVYFFFCLLFLLLFFLCVLYDLFYIYLVFECFSMITILILIMSCSHKYLYIIFKYLIINLLTSMLFLFAIIYIYILLGTTKLGYIYLLTLITFEITLQQQLSICLVILLCSLFIKIGVIPFHSWIFLIYNIMPFSLFFFFLICTKLSFFYILFILYLNFYSFEFLFNVIFVFFGFLNLMLGPFLVFNFKDLKRFLLATSLVSSGYVFFSLINSKLILNTFVFIFYLISSQLSLLGIFLVISLVHEVNLFTYVPTYSNSSFLNDSFEIFSISSYSKPVSIQHFIWKNNSFLINLQQFPFILKCFLIIFIFSLLGLPPFIGFFSKYLLLFSLFLYQHSFAFIIIFITALNGLYYFNFVLYVFLPIKHIYYVNNNIFILCYLIGIFILHVIYFLNFYLLIFFFYLCMLRIFYIYIILLLLEFDKPYTCFISLMSDFLKGFLPFLRK